MSSLNLSSTSTHVEIHKSSSKNVMQLSQTHAIQTPNSNQKPNGYIPQITRMSQTTSLDAKPTVTTPKPCISNSKNGDTTSETPGTMSPLLSPSRLKHHVPEPNVTDPEPHATIHYLQTPKPLRQNHKQTQQQRVCLPNGYVTKQY